MATQNLSGYAHGGSSGSSQATAEQKSPKGYWSLGRLKQAYLDYINNKREEIDEQQDSRRYVHGSHWTNEQLTQLNLRKQPPTYENIVGRKIRGVVGTLERLKQDPKAFARTPKHESGAELATAALRYALESQEWAAKDPLCTEQAAIDGIGGVEFNIIEGDQGDPEIEIAVVDGDYYFYDPRSFHHDFSDAMYRGTSKWMDLEGAIEWMPDQEDEIRESVDHDSNLTTDSDREQKWSRIENDTDQVRIVECWYKHKGKVCYSIYTGSHILAEGESPFVDERGKSQDKYEMFSAYVDQDGDRYGLLRDLKPLNQSIDMCKSKALYASMSRRMMAEQGAFDDVEVARRESARTDGVVIYNKGFEMSFDDAAQRAVIEAMFKFYEVDRVALDSFGPNVSLLGEGLENSSGRAIHLRQQAGLADLGPFMQAYKGWKLRVYRKMWNAIQRHWQAERWIRVTDDDDLSQFIQVNGVEADPMTGQPSMVNAIGSLDVDIILDEGADSVNQAADTFEAFIALAQKGADIPAPVLMKLNPYIPLSQKKKVLEMLNPSQPDPKQEMREQVEMQMGVESVKEKAASAQLKQAQAMKAQAEAQVVQPEQPEMGQPGDHPMKIQTEALEKQASAEQKAADAEKKRAETQKIYQDIQLEPQRMMMEQQDKERDRAIQMHESERNRQLQAQDSDRNYQVNKMKAKQKPAPRAK